MKRYVLVNLNLEHDRPLPGRAVGERRAFYTAAVETVANVFDVLDRSLAGRRPGG